MFSSTNSGISMLQLPPATLSEDETLPHYYHLDLLSHCLLETPINSAVLISTKGTTVGPEVYPPGGDHNCLLDKHTRLLSERKNQHRKILTAQGLRDRRVRLSKDIARKFFDLQDFLGFDRASKTLDWLLKKSKTSIKELTQMKHIDGPSAENLCSSSECENLDLKKSMAPKKKRKRNPAKPKQVKALQMAAFDEVAKELRAKARARARERTKEKKFLRELTEGKKHPYSNPYIPNQARTWSQIESCNTSESNFQKRVSSPGFSTGMNGSFCLQPNLIISRESSSNFSQRSPNTTENWDINSTVTSSNLCAFTDPTVLQFSRKPLDFEDYSNRNERLMW